MGLRITTNVASLGVSRNLRQTGEAQDGVSEKLASGQRVNKAADDAATLAISEKARADIRSIRQGGRNANDGIGVVQTAESALNEVSSNLIRIRELSIQAASGTYSDNERSYVQEEANQLVHNIRTIISGTDYNGMNVFAPGSPLADIQVGIHNDPGADRIGYQLNWAGNHLADLRLESIDMRTQGAAQHNLDFIDKSLNSVQEVRSVLGASQNRLMVAYDGSQIAAQNMSAGLSQMRDADIAHEHSEFVRGQIQQNMGTSMLVQANNLGAGALKLLQM